MKLIHSSGEPYDITSETKIELTRYNPFFNNLGEQSLPVNLPPTDKNIRLLGNPQLIDNQNKIPARIDAQIQSGVFCINARQVILSAKKHEGIQTSFYIREGAFYEKTKDVSLMEVFSGKYIDFANIDAAIDFMRSLFKTTDPRFACFPVATDNHIINKMQETHTDGYARFFNDQERVETIDGKEITIPKGFYISPFVKVKHLFSEVATYLGYTLAPSFLDNPPFSDMVFLNNTLDTIAAARINYTDIVPNIMLSTLFESMRKFNVEVIPDEQTKNIRLVHFDDTTTATAVNLTNSVRNQYRVNYHHDYRQFKLTSEFLSVPEKIKPFTLTQSSGEFSTVDAIPEKDDIINILSIYPSAYIRYADGAICVDGFSGEATIKKIVATLAFDYYNGGILNVEEKKFPDVVTPILFERANQMTYPYTGAGRFFHSAIAYSDNTVDDQASNTELKAMFCLVYRDAELKHDVGTLSNYSRKGVRLWDYSLQFNGADGIFEKFWRRYDTLLRNAFLEVEFDLLLSEQEKFTIRSTDKISIANQEYLLSELKYIPEEEQIQTVKIKSLKQQEPLSIARTESQLFSSSPYKWILRSHRNFTISYNPQSSGSPYVRYKSKSIAYFPVAPTHQQYTSGGRYYERQYQVEYGLYIPRDQSFIKEGDGIITTWLEPALV